MKKMFRFIFPMLLGSLLTFVVLYFFIPSVRFIELYPWDLKDGTQFGCSVKMGAVLFPEMNYKKHVLEKIKGKLFTNDKTRMAIEIDGQTLKLLTTPSVEGGMTDPAKYNIISENENEIVAIYSNSESSLGIGADIFILSKKTGVAVWTKSRPSFFTNKLPGVQSYYLECR